MSRIIRYKLMPRTSFHIGARGIGIEQTSNIVHSDTLFSAIVSAWRHLGEEMDSSGKMRILEPFFCKSGQPPFKLSSAFPFAGDVFFYPAPLIRSGGDKEVKKAEFLSKTVLLSCDIKASVDMQGGKVRLTQEERDSVLKNRDKNRDKSDDNHIWKSGEQAIVPRVTIDRISSASEIYHCGKLYFSEGCGLYFWLKLHNEAYDQHVERAIDFLSEEGIGGERSSGCGQFTYEKKDDILPSFDGDVRYMTLSLYHPTCAEVANGVLDGAAYNLVNCKGWICSPDGRSHRRRTVRMISEGSVFSQHVVGNIVDLKPSDWPHHAIHRSGVAFTLRIPREWEVRNDG